MAYKPGSFSKNFAWHGTGLRKLYDAIRAGFSNKLDAVPRDIFRSRCGIRDRNLDLIPLNFFLFNSAQEGATLIAVDQLVHTAVSAPHSLDFDRLALFAMHLNMVGHVDSGGTPWANKFVREVLWQNGFWNGEALTLPVLDRFLSKKLDAEPDVRRKCRANYRHLFELCEYLPFPTQSIDNQSEPWLSAAIFLAWDRLILNGQFGGTPSERDLVDAVEGREAFKLLGVPKDFFESFCSKLAVEYRNSGMLERFLGFSSFTEGQIQDAALNATRHRNEKKLTQARILEIIGREETARQVQRRTREIESQQRNEALAAALKELYSHRCMFCCRQIQIRLSPKNFYSEAAHIQPLGRPHNGPDIVENMLILCPNCHQEFDSGTLMIETHKGEFVLRSLIPKHPLHGKAVKCHPEHRLHAQYLCWHSTLWLKQHGRAEEKN